MWQHDALPHVAAIARRLGVDIEEWNRNWIEDGRVPGYYRKRDSRDVIAFIPYATAKIRRIIGRGPPTW